MDLPDDIEDQIADYLAREYGEYGAGRIRASDLRPLGERVVDGVRMWVWSFPSSNGEMWATVEPMGESYCIGIASPPRPQAGSGPYRLYVETEGTDTPLSMELAPLDEGLYGTLDDVRLETPSGQVLLLSVEVVQAAEGDDLSLSILAGDEMVLAIRAFLPCVVLWSGLLIRVGVDNPQAD